MKTARILIIAGSDSSGGAGIQADIKTVTMLGGHAMTAITAVTAQNTQGVSGVHPIPTQMVLDQIEACVSDIGVDAVKIGMIGSAETAMAVAEYLDAITVPIVFDPVMVATSGSVLADEKTIEAFGRLMAIASIATPNLPEAEALGGVDAMLRHGCHIFLKGGHGDGPDITDRLHFASGETRHWTGKKFDVSDTHGTGCTVASAIACGLGQGMDVVAAIKRAISFVRCAILEAPGLGQGCGPLGQQHVTDF